MTLVAGSPLGRSWRGVNHEQGEGYSPNLGGSTAWGGIIDKKHVHSITSGYELIWGVLPGLWGSKKEVSRAPNVSLKTKGGRNELATSHTWCGKKPEFLR